MNILDFAVMTPSPIGQKMVMAYYWRYVPSRQLSRGLALGWIYHAYMHVDAL